MALAANAMVKTKQGTGEYYLDYIVKTGVTVYQGALLAVEASSGHLILCAAKTTPRHKFIGIATEKVVGNGALKCRVQVAGAFEFTLASVAQTDIGAPAYATADDTLTLSADDGGGNLYVLVGPVIDYVTTNTALVLIAPKAFITAAYA